MAELMVAAGLVVFVSAMCSLCEAVLYSVPSNHIEALVHGNRNSGRILQRLRREVDRPISAILSLNTIANTGGAVVVGAAAAEAFGHRWLGYFAALFTLVILIFSKVIPRTAGAVYSRSLAAAMSYPLQFLVWMMAPMVWLSRLITRLVGHRPPDRPVSEKELMAMVRLGGRTGTIRADKVEAIANILSLESRTAADVMTPRTRVFALNGHLTVEEVRDDVSGWPYNRIPVYDEGRDDIIGLVYRREVLGAIAGDRHGARLMDLMKPVHFVKDSLALDALLRVFLERRQHMLVVIDRSAKLAGVVTLEDVAEEILGREIVDEFDRVAEMRELARRRRDGAVKKWKTAARAETDGNLQARPRARTDSE